MRNIRLTNEARCGEEEFKNINLSEYAKEHFGMFHGQEEHVSISFISFLLDTVVDRFGIRGVVYNNNSDALNKAIGEEMMVAFSLWQNKYVLDFLKISDK
jgi:hypothetical protein